MRLAQHVRFCNPGTDIGRQAREIAVYLGRPFQYLIIEHCLKLGHILMEVLNALVWQNLRLMVLDGYFSASYRRVHNGVLHNLRHLVL